MGCCFSSDDDDGYQDCDVNETSRLLSNPVSEGVATRAANSYVTSVTPPRQKGDEQSALNRILHQTASEIIDVAALDSQPIEQHDYMDRARQYSNRLTMMCNSSAVSLGGATVLPVGVAAPQVLLAAPTISHADKELITTAAQHASRMIRDIRVKHKEDLVVPFNVP